MVGLLLGIFGGLAIGALVQRRRACRHHRGPWGMVRALDLDRSQKDELGDLFFSLRRTARGLRGDDDWRRLISLLAAPSFDRAALEKLAHDKTAAFERLKAEVLTAVERAHAVLQPEQRARLADWFQVGFSPGGGPYR
jgi:Spy/CpxP family protein refolding chaperone